MHARSSTGKHVAQHSGNPDRHVVVGSWPCDQIIDRGWHDVLGGRLGRAGIQAVARAKKQLPCEEMVHVLNPPLTQSHYGSFGVLPKRGADQAMFTKTSGTSDFAR